MTFDLTDDISKRGYRYVWDISYSSEESIRRANAYGDSEHAGYHVVTRHIHIIAETEDLARATYTHHYGHLRHLVLLSMPKMPWD
jgi:hypothetical protein